MKLQKKALSVPFVVALLGVLALAAEPAKSGIQFKNVIIPGALYVTATAINNSGIIIGYYVDQSGVTHGFLLSGTTLTTIDDPKGIATFCRGINSSGEIVGEYTQSNENNHGFLYQNGTFTDIGIGVISGASGINDSGVIVGGYLKCGLCAQLGFIFDGATYTTLQHPGSSFTSATGINNRGTVTITAANNQAVYSAWLYDDGAYTNVSAPGFSNSYATGINNTGGVLLTVQKTQGNEETEQGAILENGKYTIFNYKNNSQVLTSALGINDHNQIVGSWEIDNSHEFALGGFEATF